MINDKDGYNGYSGDEMIRIGAYKTARLKKIEMITARRMA